MSCNNDPGASDANVPPQRIIIRSSGQSERCPTLKPHLASAGRVLDVVFRAAAGLDVSQVQLLVQDLNLQKDKKKKRFITHKGGGGRRGPAQQEEIRC